MNASVSSSSGPSRPDPSGPAIGGRGVRALVATGITVAGYAVLLVLGFVAGIVCSLAGAWLSWLWGTGSWKMFLAAGILVVFFAVLYTGCRIAGWAMGSRFGAGLPALGWVLAWLSFLVLGEIEVLVTVFGLVFQLGSIVSVLVATVRTDPASREPMSTAKGATRSAR